MCSVCVFSGFIVSVFDCKTFFFHVSDKDLLNCGTLFKPPIIVQYNLGAYNILGDCNFVQIVNRHFLGKCQPRS